MLNDVMHGPNADKSKIDEDPLIEEDIPEDIPEVDPRPLPHQHSAALDSGALQVGVLHDRACRSTPF